MRTKQIVNIYIYLYQNVKKKKIVEPSEVRHLVSNWKPQGRKCPARNEERGSRSCGSRSRRGTIRSAYPRTLHPRGDKTHASMYIYICMYR